MILFVARWSSLSRTSGSRPASKDYLSKPWSRVNSVQKGGVARPGLDTPASKSRSGKEEESAQNERRSEQQQARRPNHATPPGKQESHEQARARAEAARKHQLEEESRKQEEGSRSPLHHARKSRHHGETQNKRRSQLQNHATHHPRVSPRIKVKIKIQVPPTAATHQSCKIRIKNHTVTKEIIHRIRRRKGHHREGIRESRRKGIG